MNLPTKLLAAFAIALALAGPAAASECLATSDLPVVELTPSEAAVGRLAGDRVGRVVAPIMINGRGPYPFIVDTGANRSVLAQGLATDLGLAPIGTGEVNSVHDVTIAPLVQIDSLRYGPLTLPSNAVPLLQGPMLAGQQGLLGVDGMTGRRLQLDFTRNCIEIVPARTAPRLVGSWTSVRGQLRFGHLVVLPGRIRGVSVNVLVDTGSDTSLANVALRDALRRYLRSEPDAANYARAYSAGDPIVLNDVVALPGLHLGDMTVSDVTAYIGDFHIFELWHMHDQPTLLIGMDVLRRTRAIAIDYERGIVQFRLSTTGPLVSFDSDGRIRPDLR